MDPSPPNPTVDAATPAPAPAPMRPPRPQDRGGRVVSPAPRDVWRAVLAADPDAVATQAPEWLDAVCRHTGTVDASRLYETPGGRRVVVPLVSRRVAGATLSQESFSHGWGYGGALVEGGGLRATEAAHVLADLGAHPRLRTTITPAPGVDGPWDLAAGGETHRITSHSQVVDLSVGLAEVTKGFKRGVRYSVRKAERLGVEVHADTTGAHLADFARLYDEAVGRWAEQKGQPPRLMRMVERWRDRPGQAAAAVAALGDRCVVWVASRHGEPVEIALMLYQGRTAHGWLAVNDRRLVRETRGSALLKAVAIEDACRRGVEDFLLGESDPGSPVESFKLQFGAETVTHHAYRLETLPFTPVAARVRAAAEGALSRRSAAAGAEQP